jgi:Flp pilus assembly protein TadB
VQHIALAAELAARTRRFGGVHPLLILVAVVIIVIVVLVIRAARRRRRLNEEDAGLDEALEAARRQADENDEPKG